MCVGVQHDVYQRFSGYVARHRLGLFCESCVAVVDGLREAALEGTCGSREAADSAFDRSVAKLVSMDKEMKSMLADLNAAGDGSLYEAIHGHLQGLASHVLQGGNNYAELASAAAQTLAQLLKYVFDQMSDGVTYNVGALGVGTAFAREEPPRDQVSGLPRFLAALDGFPASSAIDMLRVSDVCRNVQEIYRTQHVFDPVADPSSWRTRDVSGMLVARPAPEKLLFTMSKAVPLSYSLIAVAPRAQVGAQELTSEYQSMFQGTGGQSAPSSKWMSEAGIKAEQNCSAVGLAYSPAHCLFDLGWGLMLFSLSTEPPFD
ncbi:unnamed protein product, partial [Polarella glacialis]